MARTKVSEPNKESCARWSDSEMIGGDGREIQPRRERRGGGDVTGLPPTGLDADPLIGAEIAQYRIDERIARGGMGVVYRAEHLRLGRTVALKVIAPELSQDQSYRARFELEAKSASAIDDPHAVPIFDYGEQEGRLYIVMRYVDGPDLSTLIEEEGALAAERAADFVAQAGQALGAAHAINVVHRDVKPANLLIDRVRGREHVFVTDFGLIRAASSSRSGLTRTGGVVGTLDFIAPEQIADDPVTAQTDVYALGCVLYFALSGEVPFPRGSDAAKLNAHLTVEPPDLSDKGLDPRLNPVLKTAMAKRPEDRFESAEAFGEAALAAVATSARFVRKTAAPKAKPEPEPAPPPKAPKPKAARKRAATPPPVPPPRDAPEAPAPEPVTSTGRNARLARLAAVLALVGVAAGAASMFMDTYDGYSNIVQNEKTTNDVIAFGLLALAAATAVALWVRRRPFGPGVVLAILATVAGYHASQSANWLDALKAPGIVAIASELLLVAGGVLGFAAGGTLRGEVPRRRLAAVLVLVGGLAAAGGIFIRLNPQWGGDVWDFTLRSKLPLLAFIGCLILLALVTFSRSTIGVGMLRTLAAALGFGYAGYITVVIFLATRSFGVGMVLVPVGLLVALLASLVAGRPARPA
ncbi:serine/threonine protein kinase [Solirubrobacter ginsenosidimutans]|uniref:non-specific serine/threonine protein kinase n=1 Tax=Solirubrobacter ginsenosidimutans TaxID=490573 RepID=A0A9X3MU77_9ACTN|nr:serine/threonine-protein kinase [Solirubrobacter ginsenosidimutans]MDA0159803.1 serine/threonine protein kinase [Solirubrobacter ginsenosidimutans]